MRVSTAAGQYLDSDVAVVDVMASQQQPGSLSADKLEDLFGPAETAGPGRERAVHLMGGDPPPAQYLESQNARK